MNEFEKKKKRNEARCKRRIKHFSNHKIEFIIDEWNTAMKRYNENIIENYYWTMYVTHALHIN